MDHALAGRHCQVRQSTSDAAPGLLASVDHHLGAHHSPDLFHVQQALSKAVSAPMALTPRAAAQAAPQAEETRTRVQESLDNAHDEPTTRRPGRPSKAMPCLAQSAQEVAAARQEPQRLSAQREQVTHSMRAIGHASHCVDFERGVRRTGTRIAGDSQEHSETIRTSAPQEHRSETGLDRLEHAERVVPTRPATIAFVSRDVRQQGSRLALTPPPSHAMHAHRIPSCSRDRVAATRTVTAGASLRARAERLRTPLFAPDRALGPWSAAEQNTRKGQAARLAAVFQRSSANVEGRNGSLSLSNHQLRGLDHPRKRTGLTAVHHFFLMRADGTTAAERLFEQKPRCLFAAILASVEIPPAPLSPPHRAAG
jgi:hypothetical protein